MVIQRTGLVAVGHSCCIKLHCIS